MESIIIDAREYQGPDAFRSQFYGGSELLVRRLVLALKSHYHVDVITSHEPTLWEDVRVWGSSRYPTECDILIACERLTHISEFTFSKLICPLNKTDPHLANYAHLATYVVLSEAHEYFLLERNKAIDPRQITIIPPGVETIPHVPKIPYSLIYPNSPHRGLHHLADQWPRIRDLVPDATLTITYNLRSQLNDAAIRSHNLNAYNLLRIRRWLDSNPPGVHIQDSLPRRDLLHVMAQSELFAYPFDPVYFADAVHCLAAQEAASASCALLLSSADGLPGVFDGAANFLSYPIIPDEWPEAIAHLFDRERIRLEQRKAHRWAKPKTWRHWSSMWRECIAAAPAVTRASGSSTTSGTPPSPTSSRKASRAQRLPSASSPAHAAASSS